MGQYSWKQFLAAALLGAWDQPGWEPGGIRDRGRRSQGCFLLPGTSFWTNPVIFFRLELFADESGGAE